MTTTKPGKIVAIGGGELRFDDGTSETESVDRYILHLTGKQSPKILFFPTASGESNVYSQKFIDHFSTLGAQPDILKVSETSLSQQELRKFINTFEVVYVGGGNTQKMLEIWKEKMVDIILRDFVMSGKIVSGLSAGANCWFEQCNTDSNKTEDDLYRLDMIACLGFIPGTFCPHYDCEPHRRPYILKHVRMTGQPVYAVQDNAALVFDLGAETIQAIHSQLGKVSYRVQRDDSGDVIESPFNENEFYAFKLKDRLD